MVASVNCGDNGLARKQNFGQYDGMNLIVSEKLWRFSQGSTKLIRLQSI